MKSFWVGAWLHTAPDETENANGRRVIIRQLCFGPLETMVYGTINNSKYYFEHHIIEGIEEGDKFFKYIDRAELLNAICNEIELCKKYHGDEIIPFLQNEKKKI